MSDIYKRMYGNNPADKVVPASKEKMPSRVLGGLKAQNAHARIVEMDGQLVQLPKMEYVRLLEEQLTMMKRTLRSFEKKNASAAQSLKALEMKIKALETEMNKKVSYK